jgi:hypothetical protein
VIIGKSLWDGIPYRKEATLDPLRHLAGLRWFMMQNVRIGDGSLEAIAKLRDLEELHLPNFFRIGEFARVTAAFPKACDYWRNGFF